VETHTSADYALRFNEDYVRLDNPSNLNSDEITISSWVYSDNWSAQQHPMIVAKGINQEWILWKSDDAGFDEKFGFRISSGDQKSIYSTTTVQNATWYHLVGTYTRSNGEMRLYVNGVEEATYIGTTGTLSEGIREVALGAGNTGTVASPSWSNFLNGNIDEVAIWDEALTATEIAAVYDSGNSLDVSSNSGNYTSSTDLQGYWKFNQASGSTATDLSGNGNHGDLHGPTRVERTADWIVDGYGSAASTITTTRTLTITDPNTTSYEIAYDLTDTTVDFSGQSLDIEIDTSDASAMTSVLLSSAKTFTIPETRRLTITDENSVQQSLQYQVGNDTSLDFSELGIELDIAGSYSGGLNGTQIEISADRDLQVGADNDANHHLQLGISSVTAHGLRIDGSQVVDIDQARAAITSLDNATDMVNQERSYLGSMQNRLAFTMSNLTSQTQNIEASRSSIQDTDFAADATDLAKNQILAQSATAMLAQASAISQNILGLLR